MTVAHRAVTPTHDQGTGVITYSWASMDNDDDGVVVGLLPNYDYTVMVVGTMGSGGTISLKGSIDGTNYGILKDDAGAAITFTVTNSVARIHTRVPYVKPVVAGGDGTTALLMLMAAYPIVI